MDSINGIFSRLLMRCANWFLYIFIAPNAILPKRIMDKRYRQISIVKRIDKWNYYYNYNQLVQIIYDGIVDRYKMNPQSVLELMYQNSLKADTIGNITVDVTEGDNTSKKEIWKDIASVVEWVVEILQKIGVNKSVSRTTMPIQSDWYSTTQNKSSNIVIPIVIGGLIIFSVTKNK